MTTDIIKLTAERELLHNSFRVQYKNMVDTLEKMLNDLLSVSGATCCCRNITCSDNSVDIYVNIVFKDIEGNVDFCSDVDMFFDSKKNKVFLNYGTCGKYSKEDIYLVKRVNLLKMIWDNVEEIEQKLTCFCEQHGPMIRTYEDRLFEINHEIGVIESKQAAIVREQADAKIVSDTVLYYDDECSLSSRNMLFNGALKVVKKTPKYVIGTDCNEDIVKLKREFVVNHVVKNYIVVR